MDQEHRAARADLWKTLGTILLFFMLCLAGTIGKDLGRFTARNVRIAVASAQLIWSRRDLGELSLDAPFSFERGSFPIEKLAPEIRNTVESARVYRSYSNSSDRNSIGINVASVSYRPGTSVNLSGAVDGGMRNIGLTLGDANPRYSSKEIKISGSEGVAATYEGKISGRTMYVKAVFLAIGQKLLTVQVNYFDDTLAPAADRILRSIALAR